MTENRKRVIVDGIEFGAVVQFPRILTSAITALQPPRLIIGLLLVTALLSGGRLWDHLVPPHTPPAGLLAPALTEADRAVEQQVLRDVLAAWDSVPEDRLDARDVHARVKAIYTARLDDGGVMPGDAVMLDIFGRIEQVRPRGAFEATAGFVVDCFTRVVRGVLRLRPSETIEAGIDLLIRLPAALWTHEKAFAIFYGLFATLVLSVGGGALSRMAACHWAGGERLRMAEAWDFALGNWWSFFSAPLLPALLVVIFGVLVAALGLLLRLPWAFQIVGALAYGVALLCGAMIAFLVVGYAFGAPLLIPAVACERCDPAEAQQRAFAYVLNRPFHRVGYGITSLVGLALGYLAISLIAVVLLNGTAAMYGVLAGDRPALAAIGGVELFALTGSGDRTTLLSGTDLVAARVMGFFQSIVLWLVGAYVVSYFFTAATLNYLLMRRACDGQEIQELWRPGPRVPGDTPGAVVSGLG